MILRKLLIAMGTGCAIMLTACGGSDGKPSSTPSSPQAEQQRTELYDAMRGGDLSRVELIADSLAFMADDLSTDESVAVFLAYLQIHNDAVAKGNAKKDLFTMRKFVEVYDIVKARGGDNITSAFNKAKELNANLDLDSAVSTFREALSKYDDLSGEAEVAAPKAEEPVDTPAVDNDRIHDSLDLVPGQDSPSLHE